MKKKSDSYSGLNLGSDDHVRKLHFLVQYDNVVEFENLTLEIKWLARKILVFKLKGRGF